MMQATELRIGNWVQTDKPEQVVDVLCDSINTAILEYIPYDMVQPIPLTPELLERCGFKKVAESEYYENYRNKNMFYISRAKKDIDFGFLDKKDCYYVGDNHTEIPSLHWLQNWYFFTYGHELEVSL